ncbi:MAG: chemotaxis protein CheA [Rhodocyclaceae bacterium]|nr:chemotaxis protein CheA [Rhodocyclaceae bacterium]
MDDLNSELTGVFVQESREQLAEMERLLLQLEQEPSSRDNLDAIFRAAHTVKGSAGVVECDFIVLFAHEVESTLDRVRNGEVTVTSELASVLLTCCDHLGQLLDVLAQGPHAPTPEMESEGFVLIGRLNQLSGTTSPTITESKVNVSGGGPMSTDNWHISVRFGADVMKFGMDPLAFLRYLASLGEIVGIETLADTMPAGKDMDPECCYLGFEIAFKSRASKSEIEAVFAFVRDDCTLHILPPDSKLEEFMELIQKLPEDSLRLGEILVKIGAVTEAELVEGLKRQQGAARDAESSGEPAPPLGHVLVEQQVVQPVLVEAAAVHQAQVSEKKAKEARVIRVHADKLDRLIDLVGEMVIAGASAHLLALKHGKGDLVEAASVLSRLVEDIRDSALQLRMVQIGETFSRFNRVVRDVSRDLGKDIELVLTGGDTELDKSVVEKIGDPLMHLVRNALDHGIEPADVRQARGKPTRGQLTLNACHDSGSIVIQVMDDGGGLNAERIRAKAVERGLIHADEPLSEQQIINLIFEAGFSTADSVSNLSGRGVGMDVVRRNIQALRGTVDVVSSPGQGCTFTIRLPLTLAIIDGFLVGVGKSAYVIPLETVVECIELRDVAGDRNFLKLRGEVLPFVRLRELFVVEGERPPRENVVVVRYAGQRAGIVVDQLMGEFQTVIKPLGALFSHLKGIGGSTILGSGEVALILDVESLVHRCADAEEQQSRSATSSNRLLSAP